MVCQAKDGALSNFEWRFYRESTLSMAERRRCDYGIHSLAQRLLIGGVLWMRISNAVFLAAAVWLIWLGARRVIRSNACVQSGS